MKKTVGDFPGTTLKLRDFFLWNGLSDADAASVLRELGEFALGRVLSFALFEEGMAYLLKLIGVSNVVNRIIVLVAVMIFNYVVSKFWVFKDKKEKA